MPYAARRRQGEAISTAFVESSVKTEIIAKRMNKEQQMRAGTGRRCAASPSSTSGQLRAANDTLEDCFRHRYPGFRPATPTSQSQPQRNEPHRFPAAPAPADLMAAVAEFQAAGNIVTDIGFVEVNTPLFPIQISQPTDSSFDVLQGGKGAAMHTAINIDATGLLKADTEIRTSNDLVGAHGQVLVSLKDFTGNIGSGPDAEHASVRCGWQVGRRLRRYE